jgi:glycosyltransferase involved in cell wall biosynthesis
MNICMFSPFSVGAPSTYRLLSFARVLTEKSHNVTIVLPSFDRYSGFKVELKNSLGNVLLSKPLQLKTRKLITDMIPYAFSTTLKTLFYNCDVVHVLKTTPISCFGYVAKLSSRVPVVQDIDDLDHLIMIAEGHPRGRTWIVAQCEKILPRLANHVIVSSSSLERLYFKLGLGKNKITQISNGVCVKEFEVDADLSIKQRYNLRDRVVTYVGSLNNEAQLSPLILGMGEVVKEKKDTSCLIIGDGTARESLQQLVHRLGLEEFVVFTGKVAHDEIPKFLSISDIGFACFPELDYLRFVSNIKVFEYMASGVPVVVSPIGDLPFYVDYGRAGVVTKPDADELSKVLVDLLSDDKKRRRLSGHAKKYVENFDWTVLTERLLRVYERL